MKERSIVQNNRYHGLAAKLGLDRETKQDLVSQHTNGRTTSSKEMSWGEMETLIKRLERDVLTKQDPADKQRKKIIHYFHELGWRKADGSADMLQIEGWMINSSYLHKSMNDYNLKELPRLVSQVEIMYKSYLR